MAKANAQAIAVVGGGTGGHVFPALAVAHELERLRPDVDVWLVTGRKAAEERWVATAGRQRVAVLSAPVPYGFKPLAMARAAACTALGTLQMVAWWLGGRPSAMLAFGGYVSVPPAIAARCLGVPYACHSADAVPDRAARVLARRAELVTVNYPRAAEAFEGVRVEVVGQPIRPWLLGCPRDEATRRLGLEPSQRTVLVMGGSQGARSLNRAAAGAARRLIEDIGLQVVHLAGERDYEEVRAALEQEGVDRRRYKLLAFLDEMQWALAAADVAVTRAGANGLAELAAAGVAMIMVPYPYAGGHQRYNAEPLQEVGAGIIVPDEELTAGRLADEVRAIMSDEGRLRAMSEAARKWARPDAARRVAELILQVAGEKS